MLHNLSNGLCGQLASIGKLGGWDSRDHDVFLKVWTNVMDSTNGKVLDDSILELDEHDEEQLLASMLTNSQKNLITKKCGISIPNYNHDEILDHLRW